MRARRKAERTAVRAFNCHTVWLHIWKWQPNKSAADGGYILYIYIQCFSPVSIMAFRDWGSKYVVETELEPLSDTLTQYKVYMKTTCYVVVTVKQKEKLKHIVWLCSYYSLVWESVCCINCLHYLENHTPKKAKPKGLLIDLYICQFVNKNDCSIFLFYFFSLFFHITK